MAAGARLLASIGDQRAARDAAMTAGHAAHRRDEVLAALDPGGDPAAAAAVAAAVAGGALPAGHPAAIRLVASLAPTGEGRPAPTTPGDVDRLRLMTDLSTITAAQGDPRGYDWLTAVAGGASATGAWADGGDRDLAVSARLLRAAQRLLLVDRSDTSATDGGAPAAAACLCPAWPSAWLGQAVEAHGVPVGQATVSFAVRWHGARPALLWEVGGGPVGLSTGLDPSWRTTEPSGEVLLHEPPATGSGGFAGSAPAGRPPSSSGPLSGPDATSEPPSPGGGSFT